MENSATPCQSAGDKKEETKGVEPSPPILTGRGGNHLNTMTRDAHNPMTRNQNFSPETPQGINILDLSPVTPQGMNNSDYSPETPQEIIPGVTSQGASGETSQKVSTETAKNR